MTTLNEKTKIDLTPKNLVSIIIFVAMFVGMYYSLAAQIQEAKELPAPTQLNPELQQAIIKTNAELEFIKEELSEIKQQILIMEQRLYDSKK
ncbi:MAG: hypothetical protein GOVbin3009_10 [Prokaryotic dsDNA virus sp.]|jgi:Tfp pilus assembly protein PilO|nr:MAG: hypothetical protein GOVbin3009_10 [Prokaryotic dsDNA virus sp.]|tara:strand:+ start:118 stop:393 length:276 start_codon:yes stop_codon:yes gene_type:complete